MTGQWDESNDLNLKFVGKYEIRTANYWFKIRWMKIRDIEMTLKSYQGLCILHKYAERVFNILPVHPVSMVTALRAVEKVLR